MCVTLHNTAPACQNQGGWRFQHLQSLVSLRHQSQPGKIHGEMGMSVLPPISTQMTLPSGGHTTTSSRRLGNPGLSTAHELGRGGRAPGYQRLVIGGGRRFPTSQWWMASRRSLQTAGTRTLLSEFTSEMGVRAGKRALRTAGRPHAGPAPYSSCSPALVTSAQRSSSTVVLLQIR